MTLSFMIKKKYLLEKVVEQEDAGTFHERRACTKFWRKRIGSVHEWGHFFTHAVFLCGRYSIHADVMNITIEETPGGIDDVVKSKVCYDIECRFLQEELEGLSIFLS